MEFESNKAICSTAGGDNRDEWGLDTGFEDSKLLEHLWNRHTPHLEFAFRDGRLYVFKSRTPRLGQLYAAVSSQFHHFLSRAGLVEATKWSYAGPKAILRKSGVRQSISPDTTVYPSQASDSGDQLLATSICFQVATLEDDESLVHADCMAMVEVMQVRFVVGLFCQSGLVRTYAPGRDYTEQHRGQFVDLHEVLPSLRFYLFPLCRFAGDKHGLWPFRPQCPCKTDWSTVARQARQDAVSELMIKDWEQCAQEAIAYLESVNFRDSRGRSPMVVAASLNKSGMLEYLKSQGGDLALADASGVSPALSSRATCAVAWLREHGIDCSTPTLDDVVQCIDSRSVARLKALLDAGAPVRGYDTDGVTPLGNAIRAGMVEGVKLLLDAGAPIAEIVEEKSPQTSALMFAMGIFNQKMVSFFLEKTGNQVTSAEKKFADFQRINLGPDVKLV